MDDAPSFEDAVTAGMNALADGITRSLDTFLVDELKAALRRIAAMVRRRPAEPSPPPAKSTAPERAV